jgi:hypothetical protein
VGNEENGYPVPDFNKMINVTKKSSDAHKKNTLKEEIWEENPENSWRRY